MKPRALIVALLFAGTVSNEARAQCEIARPGSELQNFWFGSAAFTGDLVALTGNGNEVKIYEPGPAGWTNTVSFSSPGFYLFENPTVFTDGQRVIVGMVEDGVQLNAEGRVYVFDKSNGFQQPIQLAAASATGFDTFGSGVAIHDDLLVVGASMTVQDVLCGPGKSLFFEHDGVDWVEVAEFHPHGQGSSMGGYGFNIDTDGVTAVIGADMDDEVEKFAGAVYIYKRNQVGWFEQIKLTADAPIMMERFGASVAIDGNMLLVGAPGEGAGSVYVYQSGPAGWNVVQVLRASDGIDGDFFGASLSLDDNYLVVGATNIDVAGVQDVGGVYMFERVSGVWSEIGNAVADDASVYNRFGTGLQLSGNQVLWWGRNNTDETRLHSLGIDRATDYCPATANSSGAPATIAASGCDSVIANDLTLSFADGPPGDLGVFIVGTGVAQTPFGDGKLCVSSTKVLAIDRIKADGTMTTPVDFQSPAAAALAAGTNAFFQAYFRDPGFGAGLNTSGALSVFLNY